MSLAIKKEHCIAEILEKISNDEDVSHFNIFGVIVDVSETKRKNEIEKFKTVLRVVDPSFYYKIPNVY